MIYRSTFDCGMYLIWLRFSFCNVGSIFADEVFVISFNFLKFVVLIYLA